MSGARQLLAVVWDFDGTLVDSLERNLRVTRRIVEEVTREPSEKYGALHSLEQYERATRRVMNWRELYQVELGFDAELTETAGRMWSDQQAADPEPMYLFEGLAEVIRELSEVSQAVVSQNCRANIERALEHGGVEDHFEIVVGYEEVEISRQKPAPDGLLDTIGKLVGSESGVVLYVGDHPTDVECVDQAGRVLADRASAIQVQAVGVEYGAASGIEWEREPHHTVSAPQEILRVANGFEW